MFKKNRLSFSNKDYTMGGIVASIFSIIALVILGYSIYLSFSVRGLGGSIIGGLGLLAMLVSLFGFIFGLVSYREKEKNYSFSFFGTFTNGLILVLLVFFIIMA